MGCVKSKRCHSVAHNANSTEKVEPKGKVLVPPEPEICSQISPVLLDYAHRLSQDIVARAVQQWVEVDRRYSDIPYIECDVP